MFFDFSGSPAPSCGSQPRCRLTTSQSWEQLRIPLHQVGGFLCPEDRPAILSGSRGTLTGAEVTKGRVQKRTNRDPRVCDTLRGPSQHGGDLPSPVPTCSINVRQEGSATVTTVGPPPVDVRSVQLTTGSLAHGRSAHYHLTAASSSSLTASNTAFRIRDSCLRERL